MTKYDVNSLRFLPSTDFMYAYYDATPKPFIFWDTCALLDAIRYLARGGGLETYRSIHQTAELIRTGKVYSMASELFVKEWNDHFEDAEQDLQSFLINTTRDHIRVLNVINYLYNSSLTTVSLDNQHLNNIFESITNSIIQNTFFIKESIELHEKAYQRVVGKRPPAYKKNEAKDCTIWETVLKIAALIKGKGMPYKHNGLFFSSNTDDFVNKEKKQFHNDLLLESHNNSFCCCQSFEEAKIKLKEIVGEWGI